LIGSILRYDSLRVFQLGMPATARHYIAVRKASGLALLLGALVLVSACSTPIGVVRADRQTMYRSLTSSVLSTGGPSAASVQLLNRFGLAERFDDKPEAVLAELRGSGAALGRDRLFALAELSFVCAERTHKQTYYLASAVYAYAFMLPSDEPVSGIDPRVRLAADLYNVGLTLGLASPKGDTVVLEAGWRPLPFGQLEITVKADDFRWGGYRFERFVPVGEFELRGLLNNYRQPGIGAPLAASLTPVGNDATPVRDRIPPTVKVPVTAFLRIENPAEGIASGSVQGQIELYPADAARTVTVEGRTVPLELASSAALAYTLEGAPVWKTEISAFLSAERSVFPGGLAMMHPYRPGRIPVVFIHGTASSPARWAPMLNELDNDPVLRDRMQFWFFTYNTSNPILLSAKDLRDALRKVLSDLDPEGRDPALRQMVLVGHSQGGLLARLMATDSGTRFWDNISKEPLTRLKMTDDVRELVKSSMFFEPLPFVKEVIFICTPHRGSFRVSGLVRDLVRRLVTLPARVVKGIAEVAKDNPEVLAQLTRTPTAVDNMLPGHQFIRTLSSSPIAPWVTTHSIIAVRGVGPPKALSDGVVKYESAHLEGVASEKVVYSGHSAQDKPETIEEVRRILRAMITAK
jgi:pimeloyl-ACP methyl ester carboxylesterase